MWPTLTHTIYTADLPPPRAPIQVMSYVDDHHHIYTYKHECSKEVHTIMFCLDKTYQSHTKCRQNDLHSVHSKPCRTYEQSRPQNKQHYTTHVNAPKRSGYYLRPKTHIQHTHSQHLSTCTQTSTNNKNTHRNKMGRHSWLPTRQSWDRLWSMRLLHPRPTLSNCKSCRIANCHRKHPIYNICMAKHSRIPCTSTYRSTPHNTNRKHNIPLHKHTTDFITPRLKHYL